jgi:hypothetical protein
MLHDLRYALRTLRRNPGFAVIAIVSLTLRFSGVERPLQLRVARRTNGSANRHLLSSREQLLTMPL